MRAALTKLWEAKHHGSVTRAKHQQMLRKFERDWGNANTRAIFEQALLYLHLQSNGRLLAFYTSEDGRDVRNHSCESIAELVGATTETPSKPTTAYTSTGGR